MARIAVVGCGYWGRNLVRNFAQLGVLSAIVDEHAATAAALAAEHGTVARSFEEVLADPQIDGVVIAAPAELHAPLALRALEHRKHVMVEKPIALSVADGEAMRVAAEGAGRALMVGHLLRYHPAFIALLDLVRAGGLGRLTYAYSNRLSLGKFRVMEDALWSLAPHDVSMLLALFDSEPVSVSLSSNGHVTEGIHDQARLDMTFADGAKAHVFASWLHPFKEQKLVVVGTEAMAVFEDSASDPAEKLRLYRHKIRRDGAVPEPVKAEAEPIPYNTAEPLKSECQHFVDVVEGRVDRPRTDASEGIAVIRTLMADS